jgi:DNA-binding protein HU-beta
MPNDPFGSTMAVKGKTVNKAELIEAVAGRLDGSKKSAAEAVEAVFDEIVRAVATGEKVAITGFGNFEKSDRAARTGRNPRTGEAVKIKATSVPEFRAGAEFKAVVSGKKKLAGAKKSAKKAAPAAKKSAKKAAPAKKSAKKAAPAKKTAKKSVKKAAPVRKTAKKSAPVRKTAKKATKKR